MAAPFLKTTRGALHRADALEWLGSLGAGTSRLVIADPPYNIGKADWDRFATWDGYLDWTRRWVSEARRVLADDGTLYICGYPEPLALIAAAVGASFSSLRWLVWFYRNKANLGDDWGRSHEAILHLRKGRAMVFNTDDVRVPYNQHTVKYPEHPQAPSSQYGRGSAARARPVWVPHPRGARPRDVIEVPTLCNGSAEKTCHPTQKPEELIRRLVLASSNEGDLVIDPFGGSGTTYAICEQTGRRWLGCERDESYCRLIRTRLVRPERFRARQAGETPGHRARRRATLRG
ncbi:MAG TPA: site-specific DNA-methyltransferase [Candidatus Polarisedimenticolia bacterium]|jgi:site-specific DNA-methyltransferase (adenine-specific)